MHYNKWIKIVQALFKVHIEIFSNWETHFKDGKPFVALHCEALSIVSQIGQMMHFHSRLLSIYEIKGLNPLLEIWFCI